MAETINYNGKPIRLDITSSAREALKRRTAPLLVEMELYFSCLIRKQLRFHDEVADDGMKLSDGLYLRFRPVMTEHCGLDYEGDEPPLTDLPITDGERYIPHWLFIDYKKGEWNGDFGYASA